MPAPDPILEALELESGSAYIISPSLRIAYANCAWSRFATSNGAPFLASAAAGTLDVLLATSPPLRPYYHAAFTRLLAGEEVWTHVYDCSTSERFRVFAMHVYPLPDRAGLIVTNSPVVERAHDPESRESHLGLVSSYLQESGFIVQCAHCRRIRRRGLPECWDWVPSWLESCPRQVSHGLCHPCLEYHYDVPMDREQSVEASSTRLGKMDIRSGAGVRTSLPTSFERELMGQLRDLPRPAGTFVHGGKGETSK